MNYVGKAELLVLKNAVHICIITTVFQRGYPWFTIKSDDATPAAL